jgi:hypothetical protein
LRGWLKLEDSVDWKKKKKKTKVMRISRQPSSIQIMVDKNDAENAAFFNCSGNVITDDARWTRGINP